MTDKLKANDIWMKGTYKDHAQQEDKSNVSKAYEDWKLENNAFNTSKLLEELNPTIESALTSYAPDSKDVLRTRARLMALNAAGMYDPKQRTKLSSYVFNHLKGLNREKAKRSNVVHIPENVILERNKIQKATDSFVSEYGREPTVEELADETGLSIKRIEYAETKGNQQSASQLLSEKGDSLFSKEEDPQQVWADYVYHDLDGPDKKIFEWSTGYGGAKKLQKMEIAKRLNLSPAAVSRRISKIIYLLEQGYNV
jgi:DNA-directed RNA polymerase specialized sigma subunit